jgi:hypothetical protein
MTLVETKLRNKMGYGHLHDCLVTYIERDFFFLKWMKMIQLRLSRPKGSVDKTSQTSSISVSFFNAYFELLVWCLNYLYGNLWYFLT